MVDALMWSLIGCCVGLIGVCWYYQRRLVEVKRVCAEALEKLGEPVYE